MTDEGMHFDGTIAGECVASRRLPTALDFGFEDAGFCFVFAFAIEGDFLIVGDAFAFCRAASVGNATIGVFFGAIGRFCAVARDRCALPIVANEVVAFAEEVLGFVASFGFVDVFVAEAVFAYEWFFAVAEIGVTRIAAFQIESDLLACILATVVAFGAKDVIVVVAGAVGG